MVLKNDYEYFVKYLKARIDFVFLGQIFLKWLEISYNARKSILPTRLCFESKSAEFDRDICWIRQKIWRIRQDVTNSTDLSNSLFSRTEILSLGTTTRWRRLDWKRRFWWLPWLTYNLSQSGSGTGRLVGFETQICWFIWRFKF